VHIVSALFIDTFEMKQAPGPATRIDITGVFFSLAAPNPVPAYSKSFFETALKKIQNNWPVMSAHLRLNLENSPIALCGELWNYRNMASFSLIAALISRLGTKFR
jgi:hypothetical protein